MKILLLTKKFPYPAKDGETIAIMQLLKGLAAAQHEVTILSINTLKHFFDLNTLPAEIKSIARFKAVTVDTHPKPLDALVNLFTAESYHYSRFFSTAFEQQLIELLQKETFDIIQLEGLYLTQYISAIRKHSNAKIVLRSHNIEFQIWERTVATMPFSLKKWYLQLQTNRLKKFENTMIPQCDAVVAISDNDKNYIQQIAPQIPAITLPVGINIQQQLNPEIIAEPFSIVHLGGMDWLPNQEGVKWFLEHVWHLVLAKFPQAKFYLAGRNIPTSFYEKKYPNYIIDGEIDNAQNYLLSKTIVIVPLLSGSGIRVKIIENMALGKCIVATTIGAEGIGATHNENILLADTQQDFAAAIAKLFSEENLQNTIGKNALTFAHENFNNEMLTEKLVSFYKTIGA
jgi:glycosyltransferase involved in cell wall biosynthesis